MEKNRSPLRKTQNETKKIYPLSGIIFIPLPHNSMKSVFPKPIRSNVVTVTNDKAADVPFKYNYWAGRKIVTIEMNLHFEPGTVKESKDVCIALDTHTLTVDLSPGISSFQKDVLFSASATNLDLTSVPEDAIVHLFCISDSLGEIIPSESIKYDKASGSLTLTNGRLSHFSLYGFGYLK